MYFVVYNWMLTWRLPNIDVNKKPLFLEMFLSHELLHFSIMSIFNCTTTPNDNINMNESIYLFTCSKPFPSPPSPLTPSPPHPLPHLPQIIHIYKYRVA